MKKKYMVRCDIEGVSGVVSYEQAEPGKAEYFFGKKMLMSDLTALVKGLNEGGAEEIVIYDEHYDGRNIDIDLMPGNVSIICGKPSYKKNWPGGLDQTFTGLILLGYHSKFDNYEGLLHHSYELDIKNIILNSVSVGEIGMEAAIAGDYKVPLLMVTGDSEGVAEANRLIDGVQVVIVKKSLCEHSGVCYPTVITSEMIYNKAKSIVENTPPVKPFYQGNEVIMKVEFNESPYLNAFNHIYNNKMENNHEIILKGGSATEVWCCYWEMKLNVLRRMEA